jgi:rhamnosyltransferase
MTAPRVSVIIPTLNGAATLPALLAALASAGERHPLEIVAIDSGSRDGTAALLRAAGATVLDLGGRPFGHASARNRAAAAARGDVLLYLTQDVEPVGDAWLDALLAALESPDVAGAFGRQIPRDASPEEAFMLGANYGPEPRTITPEALRTPFGPGATWFSHAFGVAKRAVWEVLPIPDIVMSEDQAWARDVLRAGQSIRYVPDAAVYHGHRLSLGRAFRRNFDSGSSLEQLGLTGGVWGAGVSHLAGELRWIASQHGRPAAIHAVMYETVRMIGFQCGRMERLMPRALARRLGEAPRP